MVVAQLVERSLPITKVLGSNPDIGKKYIEHFTVNCIAGNCPFFKKSIWFTIQTVLRRKKIVEKLTNEEVVVDAHPEDQQRESEQL